MITPSNLLRNIDEGNVGPWSNCYLAEIAIKYYEPRFEEIQEELGMDYVQLMARLCDEWQIIVAIYHLDVGYKKFPKGYVNNF